MKKQFPKIIEEKESDSFDEENLSSSTIAQKREQYIKNTQSSFKIKSKPVLKKKPTQQDPLTPRTQKANSFERDLIQEDILKQNEQNMKMKNLQINALKEKKLSQRYQNIGNLVITGAAGYLGTYLVEQALKNNYKVVAGVHCNTSVEKKQKIEKLKINYSNNLKIVYFDLKNLQDIQKLLIDGECVIHCAAISRRGPETNSVNVLYPEIEGIINLLTVCEKKQISRFILIGCLSNVMTGNYQKSYNETQNAKPDQCDMYERAKFFVERCAWSYLLDKKDSIKLTVFLPGLLLGPIHLRNEKSSNVQFFKKILKTRMEKNLRIKIPVVDVRDVTKTILDSVKKVSAFNQRYILNQGTYWLEDIIQIFLDPVEDNYKDLDNFKIKETTKQTSYVSLFLLKFLSLFDKNLNKIVKFTDNNYVVNNEKSKKDLDVKYTHFVKSLRDMRKSFILYNIIDDIN